MNWSPNTRRRHVKKKKCNTSPRVGRVLVTPIIVSFLAKQKYLRLVKRWGVMRKPSLSNSKFAQSPSMTVTLSSQITGYLRFSRRRVELRWVKTFTVRTDQCQYGSAAVDKQEIFWLFKLCLYHRPVDCNIPSERMGLLSAPRTERNYSQHCDQLV